jgi:ketosteroid isomerase-like protein
MAAIESPADASALADLNDAYVRAVLEGDVATFDRILADDFLCTNPDGTVVDRSGFLRQTAAPPALDDLRADDVRIRVFGDAAVIHGRTAFTTKDGRRGSGRYTDVWHRRDGRWLAVAAHVTRSLI